MIRTRLASLGVIALAAASLVGLATPAQAVQATQPTLVNAVPAAATPDVNNGVVYAIAQVGSQMLLGGSFTSVSPHATPGTVYTHNYTFAFNATTGAIDNTGYLPVVNGEVDTIIPGPAANEAYIGGQFTTVNGVKERVALVNTLTGAIVPGWKPPAINADIDKLVLRGGLLFVGGGFSTVGGVAQTALVALNPTTGAVSNYVNLVFAGHHNYNVQCNPTTSTCADAGVGIKSMDINPAGTQMVVIGNFTSVGGDSRDQIALLNLGTTSATVDRGVGHRCLHRCVLQQRLRQLHPRRAVSPPDGTYFVVAATGGSGTNSDGTNSSCDTAARYESTDTGTDVRPTWIDYTGQDSFWSVAVTGPRSTSVGTSAG